MLGKQLKKYRLAKKMTQTEVGKLFGVGKGTVSAWESGTGVPAKENADKISQLLKGAAMAPPAAPSVVPAKAPTGSRGYVLRFARALRSVQDAKDDVVLRELLAAAPRARAHARRPPRGVREVIRHSFGW